MDILKEITTAVELLNTVDEYYDKLPARQSEVDSKISDIYHYIENPNTKITSKTSYRLTKKLKECLLERRVLKKEQSILDTFNLNRSKLNLKTNRQMLLADINREKKQWENEYKFRIYDEEEFRNEIER